MAYKVDLSIYEMGSRLRSTYREINEWLRLKSQITTM